VVYPVHLDGTLTGQSPRMRHYPDCNHFDFRGGRRLGTPVLADEEQMRALKPLKPCASCVNKRSDSTKGGALSRRHQLDAGQGDDANGWPDAEIQPTLAAYFAMLQAELASQPYVKAAFNREVQAATGRSRGAVEFKFANVSAVLREIGLPYVLGYQPRANIQGALRSAVERFLASDAELARLLEETPAPNLSPTVKLVEVDPPLMVPPSSTGRGRTTIGVDYLERQARNRDVGLKGELLVVEHERAWLSAHGRSDLAELVTHVPGTLGDGAGYDVSSFLLDGSPHHIEVKATCGSITAPFFLSANELRYALEHPAAYSIYRIFDLGPAPGFYKLTGNMTEILDLTPVCYQVRVKVSGAPATSTRSSPNATAKPPPWSPPTATPANGSRRRRRTAMWPRAVAR